MNKELLRNNPDQERTIRLAIIAFVTAVGILGVASCQGRNNSAESIKSDPTPSFTATPGATGSGSAVERMIDSQPRLSDQPVAESPAPPVYGTPTPPRR